MTAVLERPVLTGAQTPRLSWMPEGDWDFSTAEECITWADEVLHVCLDDWQKLLLRMMLAKRPDGKWACRQFATVISRQNGKSWVLLIRCLFGIIELGERDVVFSAHLGDTIRDAYDKALVLLLDPEDPDRVKPGIPPFGTNGSDGRQRLRFELATGTATMKFRTRTKSGGRGLTGEVVVLDEAQELVEEHTSALGPILGSKSMTGNPQILLAGSAGDFESVVFGRIRQKGIRGGAPRLGFAEWSFDPEVFFAADTFERERIVHSEEAYAEANPTLHLVRPDGTGGISLDFLIEDELDLLGQTGQAREHLGVGTWPKDDGAEWVIPRAMWNDRARRHGDDCPGEDRCSLGCHPLPAGRMVLAISGAWGTKGARSTSISATVGTNDDCHSWLQQMSNGTEWAVDEVVRLAKSRDTAAVMVDTGGPAAPLIPRIRAALEPLGIRVVEMSGREMATACGDLLDAVTEPGSGWSHRGQLEVTAALAGAKKKDLGAGLWLFDKAKSESDIAPLESLAWARFGWVQYGMTETESWGFFE